MGVFKSIAAAVGIGESPAEKVRKKEKRAAQAATEQRAKALADQKAQAKAKAAKAAGVITKRKEGAQEAEAGKASVAGKLALISTSSQGVLSQASTGRRKLFGN